MTIERGLELLFISSLTPLVFIVALISIVMIVMVFVFTVETILDFWYHLVRKYDRLKNQKEKSNDG